MDPRTDRMRRDGDAYMNTVDRLEPDIHPIDASAFYASAAISLRRIADNSDKLITHTRIVALIAAGCVLGLAIIGFIEAVSRAFR